MCLCFSCNFFSELSARCLFQMPAQKATVNYALRPHRYVSLFVYYLGVSSPHHRCFQRALVVQWFHLTFHPANLTVRLLQCKPEALNAKRWYLYYRQDLFSSTNMLKNGTDFKRKSNCTTAVPFRQEYRYSTNHFSTRRTNFHENQSAVFFWSQQSWYHRQSPTQLRPSVQSCLYTTNLFLNCSLRSKLTLVTASKLICRDKKYAFRASLAVRATHP